MAKKGREGFEEFYSSVYGERWEALRSALWAPVRQVARVNPFVSKDWIQSRTQGLEEWTIGSEETYLLPEGQKIDSQASPSGVVDFYIMDPASIFPPLALEVSEGDEVLDLCAAPGGKSLILAQKIAGSGRLVANEMSDKRRKRLRAVLEDYLPKSILEKIQVTGHDGSKWCLHEKDAFDRILIDAPCSGERHLLMTPEEMKVWSPARSKNLAVRQYALLTSALAVVREGGRLVYSTCSLSPFENDAVIARLLKKRSGEARVVKKDFPIGEETEFGWILLPDQCGFGPIYFAALEKLPG